MRCSHRLVNEHKFFSTENPNNNSAVYNTILAIYNMYKINYMKCLCIICRVHVREMSVTFTENV